MLQIHAVEERNAHQENAGQNDVETRRNKSRPDAPSSRKTVNRAVRAKSAHPESAGLRDVALSYLR